MAPVSATAAARAKSATRWRELPEEEDIESGDDDAGDDDDDLWQCDTKGSLVLEVAGVEECRRSLHETFREQLKIWF